MNIKNWFKPNDWTPVWSKSDSLIFDYNRRKLSTGRITDSWQGKVNVLIEIVFSKSRNEYKLQINTGDAKYSKYYAEAISKLNELRGMKID